MIDLSKNLDGLAYPGRGTPLGRRVTVAPGNVDAEMLRELVRAEAHFTAGGGFVGAHYFIHRWKGHSIPDASEERRQSLERLMSTNQVETYSVDGKTALRALEAPEAAQPDEDETVEMSLTDAMKRLRTTES